MCGFVLHILRSTTTCVTSHATTSRRDRKRRSELAMPSRARRWPCLSACLAVRRESWTMEATAGGATRSGGGHARSGGGHASRYAAITWPSHTSSPQHSTALHSPTEPSRSWHSPPKLTTAHQSPIQHSLAHSTPAQSCLVGELTRGGRYQGAQGYTQLY